MALLSFDDVRDGLAGPSIYPQELDFAREAILFIRLDENAYRAASFLDQRILTARSQGRWVRFSEVAPWIEGIPPPRPLHFIFHAGHVGSTLVSRLLDEAGGVLPVREPLPLRTLATAHENLGAADALVSPERADTLGRWLLTLWSRGYADTRAVVLKATSSAARLCPVLLNARSDARAIYLYLAAEPYLATVLAGENSYIDLRGHGPERIRRLSQLAALSPAPLYVMSIGEIAALTWAVEKLTQARAQAEFGDRILALDFDVFLRDPSDAMRKTCAHLSLSAPESFFAGVHTSPVLARYSKAPEHAYTPQLRNEVLAASRARNAAEIGKGLRWIGQLAQRSPTVAATLSA